MAISRVPSMGVRRMAIIAATHNFISSRATIPPAPQGNQRPDGFHDAECLTFAGRAEILRSLRRRRPYNPFARSHIFRSPLVRFHAGKLQMRSLHSIRLRLLCWSEPPSSPCTPLPCLHRAFESARLRGAGRDIPLSIIPGAFRALNVGLRARIPGSFRHRQKPRRNGPSS